MLSIKQNPNRRGCLHPAHRCSPHIPHVVRPPDSPGAGENPGRAHRDRVYVITSGYVKKSDRTTVREIEKAVRLRKQITSEEE